MNASDIVAIKKNYTDKLIRQYQDKPKAKNIIEEFVDLFLQNGLLFDLKFIFDIETQIGVQLDLIGKIVGVNRNYIGFKLISGNIYFAFGNGVQLPTATFKGFGMGAELGGFLSTENASQTLKLNDDDFRVLLKLKAIFNFTSGSEYDLDNVLFVFFGENALLSSDSIGTIKYTVTPAFEEIFNIAIIKKVIPKPMGVSLSIQS